MRSFTAPQLALLQSSNVKARILTDWYLDDGTHHFCDDVEDMTDGTTTWLGASILGVMGDIKSSQPFAAESVTLQVDGTRLLETGFIDPGQLFRDILTLKLHQRRVDFWIGLSYPDEQNITLAVLVYAGKINNAKVVYPKAEFTPDGISTPQAGILTITLDSLAARYGRVTGRTRSHADQQDIDPTDLFFQYTVYSDQDQALFWGKSNPNTGNQKGSLQYRNESQGFY